MKHLLSAVAFLFIGSTALFAQSPVPRTSQQGVFTAEGITLLFDKRYFTQLTMQGVPLLFANQDESCYLAMLSVAAELYRSLPTAIVARYSVINSPDKNPSITPVTGTGLKDASRVIEKLAGGITKETWIVKGKKKYYILSIKFSRALPAAALDSIHGSMAGIAVEADEFSD